MQQWSKQIQREGWYGSLSQYKQHHTSWSSRIMFCEGNTNHLGILVPGTQIPGNITVTPPHYDQYCRYWVPICGVFTLPLKRCRHQHWESPFNRLLHGERSSLHAFSTTLCSTDAHILSFENLRNVPDTYTLFADWYKNHKGHALFILTIMTIQCLTLQATQHWP